MATICQEPQNQITNDGPLWPTIAALVFAMAFPSLMSWIEFWVLPAHGSGGPDLRLVFGVGKVIQFAFPILFVWFVARQSVCLTRPSGRGMGVAIGFALFTAIGMFVLYFGLLRDTDVLGDTPIKIAALLDKFHANSAAGFIAFGVFIAGIHAFLEEYYWRWFVFGRLRNYVPLGVAIAVSSLAFMSHHVLVLAYYFPGRFWSAALPFSLCVAVGGAVWAWLYHRSGNLWAPWVSHLIVDAAIMVVGYDLLGRTWPG